MEASDQPIHRMSNRDPIATPALNPIPCAIPLPIAAMIELCDRWKIVELALFGSVLRDDFRPDSDVDLLLTFAPGVVWSLFDWMDLQQEFTDLLDRPVDLVNKAELINPYRRREILATAKVIYANQPT